jgi:hypothetical protein
VKDGKSNLQGFGGENKEKMERNSKQKNTDQKHDYPIQRHHLYSQCNGLAAIADNSN